MTHGEKFEQSKEYTAFLRKMNWIWIGAVSFMWFLYFTGIYVITEPMMYAWGVATMMGGFTLSLSWSVARQEKRIDELWKLPENKARYNKEIEDGSQ